MTASGAPQHGPSRRPWQALPLRRRRRSAPSPTPTPPAPGDGNRIVNPPVLENSEILFEGRNNVLHCAEPGVVLENSTIRFKGNNAIVYLSQSRRVYRLRATVYHRSVIHIGKHNFFNSTLRLSASERKNIVIGDGCLFSSGCVLRTADVHLIYDVDSKQRINPSKNVYVGDHVWIGEDALVLKGSAIGSGAIVGAGSVVAGKTLKSNASYAGNPARLIRDGVFFPYGAVHGYRAKDTERASSCDTEEWIYRDDPEERLALDELDEQLAPEQQSAHKLRFLGEQLDERVRKNRFYLGAEDRYVPR